MKRLAAPIFRHGLARRLAVVNIVALFPLALLALLQTQELTSEAEANLAQAAMGRTLQAAQPELRQIFLAQTLSRTIATSFVDKLADPASCSRELTQIAQSNESFAFLGIVAPNGEILCANTPSQNPDTGPHLFSGAISDQRNIYVDHTMPSAANEARLTATHPVLSASSARIGTVVVSIPHRPITTVEAPSRHGISGRPVALITFDPEGEILTSSLGQDIPLQPLPAGRSLKELAAGGEQVFTGLSMGGVQRVFAVVDLTDDVHLLGTWALDDAAPGLSPLLGPYILAALMGLAGLIAAIFAAERLVIRHIDRLARAMRQFMTSRNVISAPDLDDPPSEIYELSELYGQLVTTIIREEASLENIAREKEHLLREVHHRTGNSMQLIASILRLHIRENASPEVRKTLEHLYGRVTALSTVHLGLYRLSGAPEVEMHKILSEVVAKVTDLYTRQGHSIHIDCDLVPLKLEAQQAVPLSLLLSEVLSAYIENDPPPQVSGIEVRLEQLDETQAILTLRGSSRARPLFAGGGIGATNAISSRLVRGFIGQFGGEMTVTVEDEMMTLATKFPIRKTTTPANDPPLSAVFTAA